MAAVAVFYVLFLGFAVYRNLTIRQVINCAASGDATSVIMPTGIKVFAWLAVKENLGVHLP